METYNFKDLFKAIKSDDFEKVNSLVDKYSEAIDINQTNEDGDTIFRYSLQYGCDKTIKFLLEKFSKAINIKHFETILLDYIYEVGVDIDETSYIQFVIEKFKDSININQTNKNGDTAFMMSCGFPKLAKLLIDNFSEAIDINQVNKDGDNALMLACNFDEEEKEECFKTIKFLIENFKETIDINHTNNEGKNALHIADENNYQDIVELLLENYGSVTAEFLQSKKHKTINKDFFVAVKDGDFEKVKSLVEKHSEAIDINQVNEDGNNALRIALWNVDNKIVEFLIETFKETININQTCKEGKTAFLDEVENISVDNIF